MNNVVTYYKGYVAISSVLVVATVVLLISITVSLLSISEGQMSLSTKKSGESVDLAEACIEEALLRLNEDGAVPTTVSLPQGTCSVTINVQNGQDWTFTVNGGVDGYSKSVQASAARVSNVTISSWKEVE